MPTPELRGSIEAGSRAGELFQQVCVLGAWRGRQMAAEKGTTGSIQLVKVIAIFLGLICCWSFKAVKYHLITITC